MFGLGVTEIIIIILAVAILFFGSKKIVEFARNLGKVSGEFKKGKREIEEELRKSEESTEKEIKKEKIMKLNVGCGNKKIK